MRDIAREFFNPPAHIRSIFNNEVKAVKEGWTTKGRQPVDSMWTFWIRSHDLEHFAFLERSSAPAGPSGPRPTHIKREPQLNEVDRTANMFDALRIDDTEDGFVKVEEGPADNGMFDFMFAKPTFDALPRRVPLAPTRPIAGLPIRKEQKPIVPEVPLSAAEALGTKATFLRFYNMDHLPPVPTSTRSISELLSDGRVWAFSAAERSLLGEHIAIQAKNEIEQFALAPLAKLVEEYEKARKDFAQIRQEVSPTVHFGSIELIR